MSLPIITGIADECDKKPEARHTPGPWSFQASPAHGHRIRTSASTSSLRFGSGDIGVVFFAGNSRDTEQCKADARLISAAPDLLGAARQASFALRELLPDHPDAQMTVRMLEDAIAKATGSAQ